MIITVTQCHNGNTDTQKCITVTQGAITDTKGIITDTQSATTSTHSTDTREVINWCITSSF